MKSFFEEQRNIKRNKGNSVTIMSAVTSRLSKQQEMKLCSMLSCSRLSLLFKASVHGYTGAAFHQKCDNQGPTVTVAYNISGYIFGAYTSKNYAQTGQNILDENAFLFSFNEREMKKDPLRVVCAAGQYSSYDTSTGPYFHSLVFLHNDTPTVYSNPGTFNFDPVEMHGNDLQLIECEVYRVEVGNGSLMEKPWRTVLWNSERRKALMDMITGWKHGVSSVKQARVLLVGPVGAGKSSFFNSINSVFKGYVSNQANTGCAGTSLTTQFRTYSVKAGRNGLPLPIVLCDTMGLEENLNAGLDIDDFTSILKGHIQNKYQFNPSMPLQAESPSFCKAPALKDKIHTVAYVLDASKVKLLSNKMVEKLAAFRRKANQMGISQLVLLTKIDEACPSVASDLKTLYHSHYMYKTAQEVSTNLGVSLSAVVPVKNYCQELELDPHVDILLLNSFVQILRATESFFDDIYSEPE
ncbi:interferon-induced protein 44-like isoform X1 [Astyanax mexicanus]|uniref:interferon-induced protein 44-like isoform X1 n=2 Tax=Astyanax mexicanus TaxID=7994 RepID=UPI0020CB4516|nr:interferon-induced protein 44-like isoform X1 [Astyanax mexicanus]